MEKEKNRDKEIVSHFESLYDNNEDEYIFDTETYLSSAGSESDDEDILAPPIKNYFMNHPHYNTNNPEYQKSMREYIHKFYTFESIASDNVTLRIPTQTIQIPITEPEHTIITAAADTGSDIEAIGAVPYVKYKEQGKVRRHKTGIIVSTGNGPMRVQEYVPIAVRTRNGRTLWKKFWCLENLPQHDYLIGNTLIHQLGYTLTHQIGEYIHKPENIDHIESELGDIPCSNYPLYEKEPQIDFSKIKVENTELREFIHEELKSYRDCLAKHEWDSGRLPDTKFRIDWIDEPHPFKQGFLSKEYWMNDKAKEEVQRQIDGMIEHDIIEDCTDPQFVSSIFTVPKKTDDVRIVFDYRKLNTITRKILHPIPRTDELLAKFKDKRYITSLDMKGGYWHIPIEEEHKKRTAFIFDGKIYQWKVLPFGPTNAPMFFQQCMQRIFHGLDFVVIYLDDISILSNSIEEHKRHLQIVFEKLKEHCIKLRLDKCIWGVSKTEYLGFIVDKSGVTPKSSYIKKIMNVPEPTTKKQLLRFLGLTQFLHRFIPQMYEDLRILTELTGSKKPDIIHFNNQQRKAFNNLKEIVSNVDHLTHPDLAKPFHVFTDASKYGLGAMLAQYDDNGIIRPVSYCSKIFDSTQQNWHVSEQEIYAVIYAVEKWETLLRYQKFQLHTDHKNLKQLFDKAQDFRTGKLFRWAVRLQDYHFECKFIKGDDNVVADWLSRESVYLLNPEFVKVKEFYDSHNKIRKRHSNTNGVDIMKLYLFHLNHTILNQGTNMHFLYAADQYEILQYPDVVPEIDTINDCNDILINTFEFLGISKEDKYRVLNSFADEVSSMTTPSIDSILDNLNHQPSPPPYIPPNLNNNDKESESKSTNLRRSERIRNKNKGQTKQDKINKEKQLILNKGYKIRELRNNKIAQKQREEKRLKDKIRNQEIIDKKPWSPHWNRRIFEPKYRIPILDDYERVLCKDNHISREMIRNKQMADPLCFNIINFLSEGNRSLIEDLPAYIQRYILSGRYVLDKNNILHYRRGENGEELLKVAPASYRKSILKLAHGKLHHGRGKMLYKITNIYKYWWPKMYEQIQLYNNCCNTCQHTKRGIAATYERTGKMKQFSATAPFQQISTDIVGPLPMSKSLNRYIVTIIDKFSRYCMLIPVRDITALSVVKAIDKWITIFGPPKSILSDNGPQFISAIYRDYMQNHDDVKLKYTMTYHPQCNGQIERLHRWVKERLSVIAYDGGLNFVDGDDDWSDYIDIIQYTWNVEPNKMTDTAPHKIVFGQEPFRIPPYKFDPDKPEDYIKYMANRQSIIKKKALEKQKIYDDLRKMQYDKKRKDKTYQIGEWVLWNINAHFVGNRSKLGPKWIGPYEIIDKFNDGQNFKIRSIPSSPENDVPNNKVNIPKRKISNPKDKAIDNNVITVPRNQIKPYFFSFDSYMSPINCIIKYTKTKINEMIEDNITDYKDKIVAIIPNNEIEADPDEDINTKLMLLKSNPNNLKNDYINGNYPYVIYNDRNPIFNDPPM